MNLIQRQHQLDATKVAGIAEKGAAKVLRSEARAYKRALKKMKKIIHIQILATAKYGGVVVDIDATSFVAGIQPWWA